MKFEKWHGCKNDFIFIYGPDLASVSDAYLQNKATFLCDRRAEIGADGILLARPLDLEGGRFELVIINSDGSLAAHCGNGVRCAAAALAKRFAGTQKIEFVIQNRIVLVHDIKKENDCDFYTSRVEMGYCDLAPDWAKDFKFFEQDKSLFANASFADLGNPHLILLFDEDLSVKDFDELGARMQKVEPLLGINVHTLWKKSSVYYIKSFERGVGHTFACGSGTTVGGAWLLKNKLVDADFVEIMTEGGLLKVCHNIEDNHFELIGGAQFVFSGHKI